MGVCGVPGCTRGRLLPPLLPGKTEQRSVPGLAPYLICHQLAALPPPRQAAPVLASDPGGHGRVIPVPQTHSLTQLL